MRLAGALFVTPQGQTTRVIAGPDAAFVARANSVTTVAEIPQAERDQLREQLVAAKRQIVGARFAQSLRESAEIVDNRARLEMQ